MVNNKDFQLYFWEKVERHCRVLQMVPFVKMIAVCNSVAMDDFNENSDIDLFVVASRNRMFLVRTLVTFLLQIKGVRRHGNKIKGRFCLSFFVDERAANLSFIAIENDIYLARWISKLKPIVESGGYFDKFLSENIWIHDVLPEKNDLVRDRKILGENKFYLFLNRFFQFLFQGWFGDLLEGRLKKWQLNRFQKKFVATDENKFGVVVNNLMLKFHEKDRRIEYRDREMNET